MMDHMMDMMWGMGLFGLFVRVVSGSGRRP